MKNDNKHREWDDMHKYYSGDVTSEDKLHFEKWLTEDSKHQELYDSFLTIIQKKDEMAWAQNLDLRSALNSVKQKHQKSRTFLLNPLWRVAASVILAIGLSVIIYNSTNQSNYIIVETSNSERVVKILADGSEVTINENSRVKYLKDFTLAREVELEGEAYFKVAHDSNAPFTITMNDTYVKVLGTEFNVNNYTSNETATVTVTDGQVEFGMIRENNLPPLLLTKGNEAKLNKTSTQFSLVEKASLNQAAWKTKHLQFRNSLLQDVAKELESVYFINIDVDEELTNRKLNTYFKNQSIDIIFEILESTLGVQIIKTNENHYTITAT